MLGSGTIGSVAQSFPEGPLAEKQLRLGAGCLQGQRVGAVCRRRCLPAP